MVLSHNGVSDKQLHIPVMLQEVLEALNPQDDKIYVDGTFGVGGYSKAILEKSNCKIYAMDRDPDAITRARKFEENFKGRFFALKGCFGDMEQILKQNNVDTVDGIVLDIGVSSVQIDEGERGFSFNKEAPLDMRMSKEGLSAADVVNTLPEKELADIIYNYGDEKASRRIAKKIVEARMEKNIETTTELAELIHSVLPKRHDKKIDTATKTFQALRIYVNDELGELERVMQAAENILKDKGRLVIVSFHSLEDSIVKKFFKNRSGKDISISRHMPMLDGDVNKEYSFYLEKNGVIKPSDAEIKRNPRARSARLRFAIRNKKSEGGYDA